MLLITVGVSATFYHVHYVALSLRLLASLDLTYPQVDTDYTSDVICVFSRHTKRDVPLHLGNLRDIHKPSRRVLDSPLRVRPTHGICTRGITPCVGVKGALCTLLCCLLSRLIAPCLYPLCGYGQLR